MDSFGLVIVPVWAFNQMVYFFHTLCRDTETPKSIRKSDRNMSTFTFFFVTIDKKKYQFCSVSWLLGTKKKTDHNLEGERKRYWLQYESSIMYSTYILYIPHNTVIPFHFIHSFITLSKSLCKILQTKKKADNDYERVTQTRTSSSRLVFVFIVVIIYVLWVD